MLRILTYNIRRFKGKNGESSAAAIGEALANLRPSLVALNEVDLQSEPEALEVLSSRLGGFHVAFFGHVAGRYGNALLSKHPILAVRETHLRGGTEVAFPAGMRKRNGEIAQEGERHRIVRGLLECDIVLPTAGAGEGQVITVAVTHLDHIDEGQRAVQMDHILEALGPNRHRSLLVGDLNALSRSDYTAEEWGALEARAASQQWAPPTPAHCLDSLSAAGFTDAFVACRGRGPLNRRPQNGGGAPAPAPDDDPSPIFTAHVGHPLYRIDYCFFSTEMGLAPLAANVRSEILLSDHFPVVFDFRAPPAGARL